MKQERSLTSRRFAGGFAGGFIGLLAFGALHWTAGLTACAGGFLLGYYHDKLGDLARDSWRRASRAVRDEHSKARRYLHRMRGWIYLWPIAVLAMLDFYFIGNEPRETEITIVRFLEALILCTAIGSFCLGFLVFFVECMSQEKFDPVKAASEFGRHVGAVAVLMGRDMVAWIGSVIGLVPATIKAVRAMAHRLRTDWRLQIAVARGIGYTIFTAFNILGVTSICFGNVGVANGDVIFLTVLILWISNTSLAMFIFLNTAINELDQEKIDRAVLAGIPDPQEHALRQHELAGLFRRYERLSRLGFWRYTAGYTARLFSVQLSVIPMVLWFTVSGIIYLIGYGLMFSVPLLGAWYFIKNLPKISDGKHWVGLVTTMTVTVTAGLVLHGRLDGYLLLLAAFMNGLACGGLSIAASHLTSMAFRRSALLRRLAGPENLKLILRPAKNGADFIDRNTWQGLPARAYNRLKRESNYGL